MANKAFKQNGVFYVHGIRKWVYRLRDKWGVLRTSQNYSSWGEANKAFNEAKR